MKNIFAAIDIGTHTARLLIATVDADSMRIKDIAGSRNYIRLGEAWCNEGDVILGDAALERTVLAIKAFSEIIFGFDVCSVRAVGTGILREASNREEFLDLVSKRTGIRIETISGEEEARLSAKGVASALGLGDDPFFLFDLGGGSTEFYLQAEGRSETTSLPIGAMRMKRRFITEDPPDRRSVEMIESYVEECVSKALGHMKLRKSTVPPVIGTGGTVVALACINKGLNISQISRESVNCLPLERIRVDGMLEEFASMRLEKLISYKGLDAQRAEVIIAGAAIVSTLFRLLDKNSISVSMSDLLDGLILESHGGKRYER